MNDMEDYDIRNLTKVGDLFINKDGDVTYKFINGRLHKKVNGEFVKLNIHKDIDEQNKNS